MPLRLTPGISHKHSRLYPSSPLTPFFDLGENQPPANSLRLPHELAPQAVPLCLAWSSIAKCPELTFSVDPEFLFSHYLWVTGTSATALAYLEFFAELIESKLSNNAPRLVYEVASNDGTLLSQFQKRNFEVLGIDPARNIASKANESGIPTIADFFNKELIDARPELKEKAGCVIARNVLPHVNDPRSVIAGMVASLHHNGLAIIEFHHNGKILKELHYDSIYHEHIFYFSVTTVVQLLSEAGLFPYDLAWSPISGGSAVLFASKFSQKVTPILEEQLELEKTSGVLSFESWVNFASHSSAHAKRLATLVEDSSRDGVTIGYGASARSSTMLNFAGLNSNHMKALADKSPYKHGRFSAGSNIEILSPEEALALKPNTILLLAWNFKDEIIQILKEKFRYTGKLIIPLPNDPVIVNLD